MRPWDEAQVQVRRAIDRFSEGWGVREQGAGILKVGSLLCPLPLSPFFPVLSPRVQSTPMLRPGAGFLRPGGAQPLPSPKPSVPLLQAAATAAYTLLVRLHTRPVHVRARLPATRDRYWKAWIWVKKDLNFLSIPGQIQAPLKGQQIKLLSSNLTLTIISYKSYQKVKLQ